MSSALSAKCGLVASACGSSSATIADRSVAHDSAVLQPLPVSVSPPSDISVQSIPFSVSTPGLLTTSSISNSKQSMIDDLGVDDLMDDTLDALLSSMPLPESQPDACMDTRLPVFYNCTNMSNITEL